MLDVLVIGGGNAALCAALTAREAGASVLLLESAPRAWRGGNSPHTRNIRCMHDAPQDVLVDAYPEEEYWQDLLKVTGGLTDERSRASRSAHPPPAATGCAATACISSRRSRARCISPAPTRSSWAAARRWSTPTTAAPRRSAFGIRYDAPVDAARARRRPLRRGPDRRERIEARACVLAAGGFESNREWLSEAWGTNERGERPAENFLIRGTRFNTGVAAQAACSMPAPTASAIRPRRTWSPSTHARRSTTAASARASIASRSASSSTARASASTTKARTSGRSAMPSGAGSSRDSRDRSPIRSSMRRRSAASCRRSSTARVPRRCPSWRAALGLPEDAFVATLARYNAACRGGTFDHTAARRLRDRGPRAAEDALGAADRHAALLRLCAPAGRDLHVPRPEGRRTRGRRTSAARRARTCSWPAR